MKTCFYSPNSVREKNLPVMISLSTRRFVSTVSSKQQGIVKWFDVKKGFGFISSPNVAGDVFVHQSSIVSATGFRSLQDGMEVAFIMRPDRAGKKQAYEVTMQDGSPVQVSGKPVSQRS